MKSAIPIDQLDAETKKKLGLRTRESRFSKEKVRTYSLKAMNTLAELSQPDRQRVIEHMKRLNKI